MGGPKSPDEVVVEDWISSEIGMDLRVVQIGGLEYTCEPLYRNEVEDMFCDFI